MQSAKVCACPFQFIEDGYPPAHHCEPVRVYRRLWGDTINIASRMESSGEPGRIQVAEGAFSELQNRYVLEPRGPIDIKGKGRLQTWFLESPI